MCGVELVHLCINALESLDELEALLAYLPNETHAWVWRTKPEVEELLVIGRFETSNRATPEQVQHIRRIRAELDRLHGLIPSDARDALKDDD